MADLPTNYFDDILSESMNGKKKFRLTYRNGTTEEVTIEDISEYDQYGSKFGAGDINKTNQAVNEKFDSDDVVDPKLATEEGFAADAYQTKLQFDEQNKNLENLGGFTPIIDETGKITGYKTSVGGADTVFPFSGEIKVSQFQIHWTDTSFVNVAAKVGYYYYVLVPWNGSDNNPLRLNNDGAELITSGYGWTTRISYVVVKAVSTSFQVYRDYLSEGSHNAYFVFESETPIVVD